MEKKYFSHIDQKGQPRMVDVSGKKISRRQATATAKVFLTEEIIQELTAGKELYTKKGPVFQTAVIAGVSAAKKTSELIPLCHLLGLDDCSIIIETISKDEILIKCEVAATAKTGVEMEAMTGASIAALTIYDMCKSFSHDIKILETKLQQKSGGERNFNRSEI